MCFIWGLFTHIWHIVNRYSVRIWGSKNPRVVLEKDRNSPKVNVWFSLVQNKTHYFFLHTVTANTYLDMISGYLVLRRRITSLDMVCKGISQWHFPQSMEWLIWTNTWLPRSSDITPLTYSYRVTIRILYTLTPVSYMDMLKRKLRDVNATITEETLAKIEIEYHI